jgi:threonine aldolase
MRVVDLRSDTVTIPPKEMLETIPKAKLGDDVYGEDATVNALEEMAAKRFGKEAAVLVTSGTQANTVSLLAQTKPGDAIILESECHIYHYELGNFATLGGLLPRLVSGRLGCPDPKEIEAMIQPETDHRAGTRLICLENTHNRAGGTILPPDKMRAIHEVAMRHGIPVHLDGARIFNAAVACSLDVKEFSRHVDTMMFCLSKGLAAPVGSVVLGDKEFISRARRVRKMLGGGMRKAGVLAAPGIYALENMVDRLREDHENARRLAEGIRGIPGIELDMETVQTNMVRYGVSGLGLTTREYIAELLAKGVKASESGTHIRMVTHYGITREDIEYTIEAIREVAKNR